VQWAHRRGLGTRHVDLKIRGDKNWAGSAEDSPPDLSLPFPRFFKQRLPGDLPGKIFDG